MGLCITMCLEFQEYCGKFGLQVFKKLLITNEHLRSNVVVSGE